MRLFSHLRPLPRLAPRLVAALALGASTLFASPAFADRVAVLPFPPSEPRAQSATEAAVVAQQHSLPAAPDLARGAAAVTDGSADTSSEYRAFGRAAAAAWTVRGTATPRPNGYRLELEVCQVETGRVELLAREVDDVGEVPQIGEMLALLLRHEGIANARLPWEGGPPKAPALPPTPPTPPTPPPVEHAYAEGRPLAIGASLGVAGAVGRPSNATGSAILVLLGASAAYHVESAPGLELRGNIEGAVAGPGALAIDVGARYALPLVASRRLFLLPDVGLGTFVTLGAQRDARFWARGAALASLGLGDRVALEAGPWVGVTPGGSGTLVFVGATARALVRF